MQLEKEIDEYLVMSLICVLYKRKIKVIDYDYTIRLRLD